jgi:hypothetical protein
MISPTPWSILPEWWLHTDLFAVGSTFVALNTVMYVALALVKLLPAVRPGDWFHHRNRRTETRSIHPDARP